MPKRTFGPEGGPQSCWQPKESSICHRSSGARPPPGRSCTEAAPVNRACFAPQPRAARPPPPANGRGRSSRCEPLRGCIPRGARLGQGPGFRQRHVTLHSFLSRNGLTGELRSRECHITWATIFCGRSDVARALRPSEMRKPRIFKVGSGVGWWDFTGPRGTEKKLH